MPEELSNRSPHSRHVDTNGCRHGAVPPGTDRHHRGASDGRRRHAGTDTPVPSPGGARGWRKRGVWGA